MLFWDFVFLDGVTEVHEWVRISYEDACFLYKMTSILPEQANHMQQKTKVFIVLSFDIGPFGKCFTMQDDE